MRLITVQKELYPYSELSESAKAVALEWKLSGFGSDDEFDTILQEAMDVGKMLGITIHKSRDKNENWLGGAPIISYAIGERAVFDADYKNAKHAAQKIRAYAPDDTLLIFIADRLAACQAFHGGTLTASITGNLNIGLECNVRAGDGVPLHLDTEFAVANTLSEFATWLNFRLTAAYNLERSEPNLAEIFENEECEFDKSGEYHWKRSTDGEVSTPFPGNP